MADLPEYIQEVRVVRPEPSDVIVLRSPDRLTHEQEVQIAELVETCFPHNKVLVLSAGESLEKWAGNEESPIPAG